MYSVFGTNGKTLEMRGGVGGGAGGSGVFNLTVNFFGGLLNKSPDEHATLCGGFLAVWGCGFGAVSVEELSGVWVSVVVGAGSGW